MATKLKHVLLHLTEEDHSHLSEMKGSLSWEKFFLKLSKGEEKNTTNEKGEKTQ